MRLIYANSTTKSDSWAFIVYPDSAIEGWQEYLKNTNLMFAISPLHDKDLLESGEKEKPHYHVVLKLDSTQRGSWVSENVISPIRALSRFMVIKNLDNMINYLTHDSYTSGAKVKYSKEDIQYLNCDEDDMISVSISAIIDFINENDCFNIKDLSDKLMERKEYKKLNFTMNKAYYLNTYLKDKREKIESKYARWSSDIKAVLKDLEDFKIEKETYNTLIKLFDEFELRINDSEVITITNDDGSKFK